MTSPGIASKGHPLPTHLMLSIFVERIYSASLFTKKKGPKRAQKKEYYQDNKKGNIYLRIDRGKSLFRILHRAIVAPIRRQLAQLRDDGWYRFDHALDLFHRVIA
jgi:chaperone required for assembly of F1-ATPase